MAYLHFSIVLAYFLFWDLFSSFPLNLFQIHRACNVIQCFDRPQYVSAFLNHNGKAKNYARGYCRLLVWYPGALLPARLVAKKQVLVFSYTSSHTTAKSGTQTDWRNLFQAPAVPFSTSTILYLVLSLRINCKRTLEHEQRQSRCHRYSNSQREVRPVLLNP